MTRQFKFRARITEDDKPKMFYQDDQYLISFLRRVTSHLYFHKDTKEKGVNEMNGGVHESYLEPFELEKSLDQYTGIKDKDGKEIYEGDIVRCIEVVDLLADRKADREQLDFVGVIEFDNEGADYNIQGNGHLRGLGTGKQMLEIIGNVYENPELLK